MQFRLGGVRQDIQAEKTPSAQMTSEVISRQWETAHAGSWSPPFTLEWRLTTATDSKFYKLGK